MLIPGPSAGLAQYLHLEEPHLPVPGVDDIVLDAGFASVGDTRLEVGAARDAVGLLQEKAAVGQGHDDVVVGMDMPAGFRTDLRSSPAGLRL